MMARQRMQREDASCKAGLLSQSLAGNEEALPPSRQHGQLRAVEELSFQGRRVKVSSLFMAAFSGALLSGVLRSLVFR